MILFKNVKAMDQHQHHVTYFGVAIVCHHLGINDRKYVFHAKNKKKNIIVIKNWNQYLFSYVLKPKRIDDLWKVVVVLHSGKEKRNVCYFFPVLFIRLLISFWAMCLLCIRSSSYKKCWHKTLTRHGITCGKNIEGNKPRT